MPDAIVGLSAEDRARPCGEYLEALPWEPPPDPDVMPAGAFLDLL
jgi:hypothetical protein